MKNGRRLLALGAALYIAFSLGELDGFTRGYSLGNLRGGLAATGTMLKTMAETRPPAQPQRRRGWREAMRSGDL